MDYDWGIISDIHLKLYNDNEYTESGLPLKLFEILEVFRNMCLYMRTNNISKVAILGDINDTKQFAAVDAFSIFKKLLEEFSDITFYIIPGNHDMTISNISKEMLNSDLRTAVDLLKGPENIITIDEPTIVDNITFVPYQYINIINDLEPTDILMSHLGLSDAVLSNGRSIRNKFKSRDLDRWKLIFLGHYHKPQQLDNVYYIGSPIPLSRSEFDEEKRYICLNSNTLDLKSINTDGYRKYFEIVITNKDNIRSKLDEAKYLKDNGNFVVIRNKTEQVITDDDNVKLINEFEPKFETRGISGRMSDRDQMSRYLEIERIPKEEFKEFLDIGLEIINKEI